jgi:hypothetical protein
MLADLDTQISVNAGLGLWDACVSRSGTYLPPGGVTTGDTIFNSPGANPDAWGQTAFPTVCNSGPPQIMPQIMGNVRLADGLGMAFGIIAPNGIGASHWGSSNGTVPGPNGSVLPAPTRYALSEANVLLFSPSIGVGWRPVDWFRVGLTLQWGIGIISFTNYTNTGMGGEDPNSDIRTQLSVVAPFVPAGILSVHFVPHESIDITLGGHISDSIGGVVPATGDLSLTTGPYGVNPPPSGIGNQAYTSRVSTQLHAGQPWQFWGGFRYGHRLRSRAYTRPGDARLRPGPDDPMADELFDVELDVVYEMNRQVTDFVVSNAPGGTVGILPFGATTPAQVPAPTVLPIVHGWSDAIVFRLGGDVNIIPGMFAIRAGASFEQPLDYNFVRWTTNDYIQGQRLGLHLGATLRIDNRFDISAAYAHFWGETIRVTDGGFRQVAATGAEGQCAGPDGANYNTSMPVSSRGCFPSGFGTVVNNGTYTQEFNIFSLAGTYHFD